MEQQTQLYVLTIKVWIADVDFQVSKIQTVRQPPFMFPSFGNLKILSVIGSQAAAAPSRISLGSSLIISDVAAAWGSMLLLRTGRMHCYG